ncbi:unannotated protein [freshwater metagenome]|uniref:Unannotated protein n=1 Tax=freshwater metagenome TaxID=449393 RepID=A0A6J7DED7_9ZZZZ
MTNSPEFRRGGVILAVESVSRSTTFYSENLGFSVEQTFEAPDYAILHLNQMRLSFAEKGTEADDIPGHFHYPPSDVTNQPTMLVVEVANCDTVHAALHAAGVTIASEVFRPPWGGGRFFIIDPDGYLIEIEEMA